jgi:hypothetical protein
MPATDPLSADRPWRPRSRPRATLLISLGLALLAAAFIASPSTAKKGGTTGDFHLYYQSAVAMAEGRPVEGLGGPNFAHFPPWTSAFMSPLALFDQAGAAIAWVSFTMLLMVVTLWVGARDAARRWGLSRDHLTTALIVLVTGLLTFNPLQSVIRNGQVEMLMLASFVFGLAFVGRLRWLSGLATGFGANIKYSSVVILPYLIFRRRFAAAAWTAAFIMAFALLPALWTGWDLNLSNLGTAFRALLNVFGVDTGGSKAAYLPELEYSRSVSITSVASRIVGTAEGKTLMYGLVAACAGAVVAASWLIYRRSRTPLLWRPTPETPDAPAVTSLEWCGAMVAVLLFSPQTQVRHMAVLALANLVAAAIVLRSPRRSKVLIAGIVVAQLGLNLPPGGLVSDDTANQWRAVGWASWCVLFFFLTMLWTGLARCREMRERGSVEAA